MDNYVWCIAYIKPDLMDEAQNHLDRYEEYTDIEIYIPTVKILKKVYKNKPQFKEVPLLFNYGFFKLPKDLACNTEALWLLRERIGVIFSWVKPSQVKPIVKVTDLDINYSKLNVATATDEEIATLSKTAKELSVHDSQEVQGLKTGDTVILQGYPFEGLYARVIEINGKSKRVKVKLNAEGMMQMVEVDFQNVFYTVYNSGNENSLMNHTDINKISSNLVTEVKI